MSRGDVRSTRLEADTLGLIEPGDGLRAEHGRGGSILDAPRERANTDAGGEDREHEQGAMHPAQPIVGRLEFWPEFWSGLPEVLRFDGLTMGQVDVIWHEVTELRRDMRRALGLES